MNQLNNNLWYLALVDDCKAIITEGVFNHRWELIRAYHALGLRINEEEKNMPVGELVERVAKDLGVTGRTVWYSVQFVSKFPDINSLPDGKNISWTKIKSLLIENKKPECQHEEVVLEKHCVGCKKKV